MRRVRTLVAGTALGFAALTLAVPAAHADSHAPGASSGSSDSSADKSWTSGSSSESGKWEEDKKPHGGPHAGIGALDDNAGLAAGGVLVAGGLGLAAYAMRRRPSMDGAQA